MNKNNVGKLIAQAMSDRDITQTKLADMIARSQGTISDLISGRRDGAMELIEHICRALVLTKEEELQIWKAWSLARSHNVFIEYVSKLEKENNSLKKLLNNNN